MKYDELQRRAIFRQIDPNQPFRRLCDKISERDEPERISDKPEVDV